MARLDFAREFDVQYAVLDTVTPKVRRIVARNPGPFTAWGTGTYVIGHGHVAIVDPGPDLAEHIGAVLDALRGETVDQILVTHTHLDHSPASAEIKRATGARSYGFGPHGGTPNDTGEEGADRGFVPDHVLGHGDDLVIDGCRVTAVHTPGHTSNHLCFSLDHERILFTGDHVMGWSTTVVSPPDGNMTAYVRSLEALLGRDDAIYLPTHGPAVRDPHALVEGLIEHRHERRHAILAALAGGGKPILEIVDMVYIGLDPRLRQGAARSVFAHLIELVEQGEVVSDGPLAIGERYRLAGA